MSNYPNLCKLSSLRSYTHPTLHFGKVWYIDFKAFDPVSGTLKRKKYNVPKAKNQRETSKTPRRQYFSSNLY